jgi:hypothetical protein
VVREWAIETFENFAGILGRMNGGKDSEASFTLGAFQDIHFENPSH